MQSPSVIQKSLPRLQVKDRTSSCGRTELSSVLLFSSQEDCPAVGDVSESRLGAVLPGSFRIIKVGKDLLRSSSPISESQKREIPVSSEHQGLVVQVDSSPLQQTDAWYQLAQT